MHSQGFLAPEVWASITFIAEPYCQCCGVPFDVVMDDYVDDLLCEGCLDTRPSYDRGRSAVIYDEASKPIILGFKHGDKTYLNILLAQWMAQAGRDIIECADCFIPVPLHYWRMVFRRYNQSALLAQALSGLSDSKVPVFNGALQRIRYTPSQGHLSAEQRADNVSGAFIVSDRYHAKIQGKTCVLIDDVYTSGATVNECARILLDAGAGSVQVLTLARVAGSAH